MTDNIELAAMEGARLDRPSPPCDMLDTGLYMGLYSLYRAYYGGTITREQARPIKNRLISAYRLQKRKWELALALQKSAADFRREVERSLDNYAAHPSKETADRLWAVASGLNENIRPRGDEAFELEGRGHR